MIFNVSEKEYKTYQEWKNKLPKKYKKSIPTWQFFLTGIGTKITVTINDKSIDITDYDTW
jgi:hypothetical protein